MHLAILLWSAFAAWRWGNWRDWKKYHATMLFMPISSLMYGLLVNDQNFYLWRYQSDFLFSEETADAFYTVIAFPAAVLLFLSNYPQGKLGQVLHVLKYVAIFCTLEWIGMHVGAIKHANGWTMLWSIWFNTLTFMILRIHYTRPGLAYGISVAVTLYLLLHFDVPLTDSE